MGLIFRSMAVSLGAALIAVFFASILALATFGRRSTASRWQAGLASSFLLLPSYVVAGAWSAGFGVMGWWTLSQVTAAKAPLVGVASVIWIHAMATVPIAYWILIIGLRRVPMTAHQLARMEGGMSSQFRHGIWPTWSVWVLGVLLMVAAWVSCDMVVTNLFQVSTLVEQCYLDMIADQVTWKNVFTSSAMSLVLGSVGMALIGRAWTRETRLCPSGGNNTAPVGPDRFAAIAGWLVVMMVVVVPIANLVIKAGWVATQRGDERIERSWSLASLLRNFANAPFGFLDEFGWSLSLAGWSASLACLLAAIITFSLFPNPIHRLEGCFQWLRAIAFGVCLAAFALPGPLVSALVTHFFQLPVGGLRWIEDHTLASPILCLQFRLVPLAMLTFGVFQHQWRQQVGDLWRMDLDKSWRARFRIIWLAYAQPTSLLWIVLVAISFGDLSSYLSCLPPGVTPVSMRIFDLLHYGVRASEAGLLLFLIVLGAGIGWRVSRANFESV